MILGIDTGIDADTNDVYVLAWCYLQKTHTNLSI